jgi:hypothetical protein
MASVDGVGEGGPQALVVVASRKREARPVEVYAVVHGPMNPLV